MLDKAPDFGLPFFYRVVLPGALITVWAYPLLSGALTAAGIATKDQAPYLIGIGVGIGFLISLLDDPIYELLEGRMGWPRWLADWRTKRWARLVKATYERQDQLKENDPEYQECWYLLRQFPVGADGNPTVTRPSRIGNVIAAYEQYPAQRYGMDVVFYWPRIWLLIDKDVRDEIDDPTSAVDSILYAGCGAVVVGLVYVILALARSAELAFGARGIGLIDTVGSLLLGLALIGVFLTAIRIAVPDLFSNGETFKSVFDLYRSRLDLKAGTEAERGRWKALFAELQYGIAGESGQKGSDHAGPAE